jgi:hypothetical protein
VERKTPPFVPAKRFTPLTAKAGTASPYGPLVCTHWATRELVLVNSHNTTRRNRTMSFIYIYFFVREIAKGKCN